MREVTLRIRHHGEPESDISAKYPDVTLRSLSSLTGDEHVKKRIIEVSGNPPSISSFLSDFRDASSVVEAEPLSPIEEPPVHVALAYRAAEWDSIAERFADMGIHYQMGAIITAGWEQWTIYLDETEDLSEIIETIQADGNDVNIVRDIPSGESSVTSGDSLVKVIHDLTPRQREVLTVAIAIGHYDRDRSASVEDIADTVGISPSTTWEHLTRAEEKIMHEIDHFLHTERSLERTDPVRVDRR